MQHFSKRLGAMLFLVVLIAVSCNNTANIQTAISVKNADTTMTPVPSSSPQATSSSSFCWPVIQSTTAIKGSFIYRDRKNNLVFAWSLGSFHTQPIVNLPEDVISSFNYGISPDGGTIAILSSGNRIYFISQNQTKSFQLPNNSYGDMQYLSTGKILVPISGTNNYQVGQGLMDKYVIFDPVTAEIKPFSVFLPNFLLGPDNLFSIQYSSDMHYVVYLTNYNNYIPQFTLFDVLQNRIMWKGPETPRNMIADPARMPIWKPDTNELTYSFITGSENYGNYYSISLDGKLTQLTQFQQTQMMGLSMGRLANPAWSPNGRYLVFKAAQGTTGPIRLYIWDDQKKVAYMPCLPDEDQVDVGYLGYWSFDGSHFLITLGYPNISNPEQGPLFTRYNTIILDVADKIIFELPDIDHRGEYTSLYGNGQNEFLGWVNWSLP